MKTRTLISVLIIITLAVWFAPLSCAQRQVQSAATAASEGPNITIKGKIEFMTNLGGFFIHAEEPGGEYFIMNQNSKVLEELLKSGKTVFFEGRIVRGAEYFFIEKIDGKPYQGAKEPASK